MRLSWLLAFAVACSAAPAEKHIAPTPRATAVTAPSDATVATVPAPIPPPRVGHPPTRAAAIAPHAGSIVAVAITPDGSAAISVDELGGARLWPALDGSKEPLVAELPHPRQLAIGPRGDGYAVAVLDDVGGLVMVQLDRDARTLAHATLPAEPPFVGIAMTAAGTLAWRSDQTLALLAADGSALGQLAAEPGQRVLDVALAGAAAYALVETVTDGKITRHLRQIEVAPKLAWGAWLRTTGATLLGTQLAVSPSGKRAATLGVDVAATAAAKNANPNVQNQQIVVIDLGKGDVVASQAVQNIEDIGFFDDAHVAIVNPNGISWLTVDAKPVIGAVAFNSSIVRPPLALGGGRVVSSTFGDLVVATPDGVQYLGYGLESPALAQPAGDGGLLIGTGDQLLVLDKELHVTRAPALALPNPTTLADARWLGGDDALLVHSGADGLSKVALLDLATGEMKIVRDKLTLVPVVMFEPSTQLVTMSLGEAPEVARFDAKAKKLDRVAQLAKPKGFEQVMLVPVAPALADGAQIVKVTMRDKPTLQWIHDARAIGKAAASVTLDGASYAGADSAGHAFVWRTTPANTLELGVLAGGKAVGRLPNDGPVALWGDPRGERVVEVGQRAVTLVKLDGTKLWTADLTGTTEALWLSDGGIAIVSAAGIARLDPASGAIVAARCGWKFGLSPKPHPAPPAIEPVCASVGR